MIVPDIRLPGVQETISAVQSGRTRPQQAVDACHALAVTLEPALRAFAYLPNDAPTASPSGRLAGVAVGVKDLIDTADMVTAYGSPIFAQHRPARDAVVVARLREHGATILGKTVTTEFAWRYPGPTRNPWNLAHTPGGSSSGSAASVAVGTSALALGTQTIGSVLRPASYCGIVGVKPSVGSISLDGVRPLAPSLDHLGVFTRSVEDAALALSLIADPDGPSGLAGLAPLQSPTALSPPRLGVLAVGSKPAVEQAQGLVLDQAARHLAAHGATIEQMVLPEPFSAAVDLANAICAYEAATQFAPLMQSHPGKVSTHVEALVAKGQAISPQRYADMRATQHDLRQHFAAACAGLDAVLTIAATGEAPMGLSDTGDASLCAPWTLTGVPAIALPADRGPNGLPLGIQIVAPFGADARLLAVAQWCEMVLAGQASTA